MAVNIRVAIAATTLLVATSTASAEPLRVSGIAEAAPPRAAAIPYTKADYEHMLYRRVLVGFYGADVDSDAFKSFRAFVAGKPIGGFVFYERNVASADQVSRLAASLQDSYPGEQFIAIDEEGGAVQRLARLPEVPLVPSARDMARLPRTESFKLYADLAKRLAGFGFNLNFGPVADVDVNPANPVVGGLGRSYGPEADAVIAYAGEFVRAHRLYGVEPVIKHFPGHGSASGDTHDGTVDVTGDWRPDELRPFKTLIADHGVRMLMTSHVTLKAGVLNMHERETVTFSGNAVRFITDELNFDGLIVTDDLTMKAVADAMDLTDAFARAILSGHHLIILSKLQPRVEDRLAEIVSATAARALTDPLLARAIEEADAKLRGFRKGGGRLVRSQAPPRPRWWQKLAKIESDARRGKSAH